MNNVINFLRQLDQWLLLLASLCLASVVWSSYCQHRLAYQRTYLIAMLLIVIIAIFLVIEVQMIRREMGGLSSPLALVRNVKIPLYFIASVASLLGGVQYYLQYRRNQTKTRAGDHV